MFRTYRAAGGRHGGPPPSGTRRRAGLRALLVVAFGLGAAATAHADPHVVLPRGLPAQVIPAYPEPGLPPYQFPTGGASGVGGGGTGDVGAGGGGDTGGGSGTGGGATGAAYDIMMATDWGSDAAAAAAAMGINPAALAATCVMESNCENAGSASGSSASGAFQMIDTTYTADINGALAYDPDIAGDLVPGLSGKMDPGTEAYAAAYELQSDAQLLQEGEIANPTVLQARAVYQFGANVGPAVAQASDSANIGELTGLTPAQLAANGLSTSSTVGQWRQTVINKLGGDAYQTVLSQ